MKELNQKIDEKYAENAPMKPRNDSLEQHQTAGSAIDWSTLDGGGPGGRLRGENAVNQETKLENKL
jgi:hypothetical protein